MTMMQSQIILHIDTETNEIRFTALDSDEFAKIKEWLSADIKGVNIVANGQNFLYLSRQRKLREPRKMLLYKQ